MEKKPRNGLFSFVRYVTIQEMAKIITDKFDPNLANMGTKQVKTLGDAIGMPDAEDEAFIRNLITIHEKMTGGLLAYTLSEARKEFEAGHKGSVHNDDARVNKDSGMTYDYEFPNSFVTLMEKHYPTMFRDRAHYHWFKRKLPGLMIRPNTKKVK